MHNNRKITPHIKASKLNDIKSTKPKMISLKLTQKTLKTQPKKSKKHLQAIKHGVLPAILAS